MTTTEITKAAKRLKPSNDTISHITAVSASTQMRSTYSVYTDGKNYFLTTGRIFNRKQNHTVEIESVDYNQIVKFLVKNTK